MVLAEVYEKDTDEFLGIIMCNDKMQMDLLMEKITFNVDVELEAVNYGVQMVLQ
jgi:hypothetical protein